MRALEACKGHAHFRATFSMDHEPELHEVTVPVPVSSPVAVALCRLTSGARTHTLLVRTCNTQVSLALAPAMPSAMWVRCRCR
jgi:hypothetical protein